jgi:hypothetical protein
MNYPVLAIGTEALFSTSIDTAYGGNTPTFVKIDWAEFLEGEWYYFSKNLPNRRFPESAYVVKEVQE